MIDPPPRARIRGTACQSEKRAAHIDREVSSNGISISAAGATGPRYRRRDVEPAGAGIDRRGAATDASSVTSARRLRAGFRRNLVEWRPRVADDHPRSGSGGVRAIDAPIPVPPPVISATLSCRTVGSDGMLSTLLTISQEQAVRHKRCTFSSRRRRAASQARGTPAGWPSRLSDLDAEGHVPVPIISYTAVSW
jgi:hypothetical protein